MDRDLNNHPGHQNSGFSSVVFRESVRQNARDGLEKKGFAENCHLMAIEKCHLQARNLHFGPILSKIRFYFFFLFISG